MERKGGLGVHVCVPEGCSLFGVDMIFFRLHLKGEVKTCSVEGITVLRCSNTFHVTRIHEFTLNHFKEKKTLFPKSLHSLLGWRMLGGNKHIFLLLNLWRKEKCGGVRWWGKIFREKNTASDRNTSGRSKIIWVCLRLGKYVNPDVTVDYSWTKLEPLSAKFSVELDSSVTSQD